MSLLQEFHLSFNPEFNPSLLDQRLEKDQKKLWSSRTRQVYTNVTRSELSYKLNQFILLKETRFKETSHKFQKEIQRKKSRNQESC